MFLYSEQTMEVISLPVQYKSEEDCPLLTPNHIRFSHTMLTHVEVPVQSEDSTHAASDHEHVPSADLRGHDIGTRFDDEEREGDPYGDTASEHEHAPDHYEIMADAYEELIDAALWKKKRPVLHGQGLDLARYTETAMLSFSRHISLYKVKMDVICT